MMDCLPPPRVALSAVLGAVVLASLAACSPAPPPKEEVNDPVPQVVVLVSIDTLRGDYLSYADKERSTMPFVDGLAKAGVVFRRAYAPSSLTAPSMASLFTGVYPTTHGIEAGLHAGTRAVSSGNHILPAELETIAESFQRAGYLTIGVPSNKNLARPLGFGQGFDFYLDEAPFMNGDIVNDSVRSQLTAAFGPEWRTTWKEGKVFLWIHYFDPHIPYMAREPWIHEYAPDFAADPDAYPAGETSPQLRKRYPDRHPDLADKLSPLYASEVRFVDDQFRRLAEELGLMDPDVMLFVTADHGEEFLEHGKWSHGKSLFEEVVHVPLLAHWPAGRLACREVETAVSILDVYPTLLGLCGTTPPAGLQGESFAPLLRDRPQPSRRPVVFEQAIVSEQSHLSGLLAGEWKLIRIRRAKDRYQLYNLRLDPGEKTDLFAAEPDRAAKLTAMLEDLLARLPEASALAADGNQDAALGHELEDLGYAGD